MSSSLMEVFKGILENQGTMMASQLVQNANQQVQIQTLQQSQQELAQMMRVMQETVTTVNERVIAPVVEKEGTTKDFKKMIPEAYAGTEGPLEAEEWIEQMQDHLTATRVPEDQQVEIVKMQMKDVARTWWKEEEKTLEKPISWNIFKEKFYFKFFPETARAELRQKFIDLKQGDLTVKEYAAEFTRLGKYAGHLASSLEFKAEMFEQGLTMEIRQSVVPLRLGDFEKILKAAQWAQAVNNEKKGQLMNLKLSQPVTTILSQERSVKPLQQRAGTPTPAMLAVRPDAARCRYCRKQGHTISECWRREKRCYACGSAGHWLTTCPNFKGPDQIARLGQGSIARIETTMNTMDTGLDEH